MKQTTAPPPPRVDQIDGDPWWEAGAMSAIETLARTGRPFTASDLTDLGVDEPDHPSRWGSAFAKAKRAGIIQRAGYTASRRRGRNGGVCAIWAGSPTYARRAA